MGKSGTRPLVSIVIPAYNREEFLRSCIDSALGQDYSPLEVLVVDDGSTDGTPQLCASYGDRISYFRKSNGGAASALNRGVREMKGSWFKWLSSDDELEPDALGALVDEGERTGAGVVYGDFSKIDANGGLIGTHRDRSFSQKDFVVTLWWHLVGSAGAAIIRKSCLDVVGGFDETLRYAEDYDWWLRAALLHGVRFQYAPHTVARYRIHPGQVTSQKLQETALLRARIRAHVSVMLSGGSSVDPRLFSYYLELTRNYSRCLAPLVAARSLLTLVPGSAKARYWTGKLLPRWSSMVHWAADPPVRQ